MKKEKALFARRGSILVWPIFAVVTMIFLLASSYYKIENLYLVLILMSGSIGSFVFALFRERLDFYEDTLRISRLGLTMQSLPYDEVEDIKVSSTRFPYVLSRVRILIVPRFGEPIEITGNPFNKEIGLDLCSFLARKILIKVTQENAQNKSKVNDLQDSENQSKLRVILSTKRLGSICAVSLHERF